jgi:hypothetical protein
MRGIGNDEDAGGEHAAEQVLAHRHWARLEIVDYQATPNRTIASADRIVSCKELGSVS